MINRALFTSKTQTWKTPPELKEQLYKEFNIDFDPCPENPTFDGLNIEWKLSNFVNPPYKSIAAWIKKGFDEWNKGKTIVFLIPARTDTRWFHDYILKATEIRFIRGRLKFSGYKNSAPFPSMIVIFKGKHD